MSEQNMATRLVSLLRAVPSATGFRFSVLDISCCSYYVQIVVRRILMDLRFPVSRSRISGALPPFPYVSMARCLIKQ